MIDQNKNLWKDDKIRDLASIGFLFVLVLIFFSDILLGNYIYYYGDVLFQNFPYKAIYKESLETGTFPSLWTPDVNSGFPILAECQTGFFYPFNFLFFSILSLSTAYNFNIIFHFLLGGILSYLYALSINLGRYAALITAIVFMFSGFLIANIQHPNMLNVAIWLPLLFLLFELAIIRNNFNFAILAGLVLGLQILAGHPPLVMRSITALFIYMVCKLFVFGESSVFFQRLFRYGLLFGLVCIVGVCLGAIQLFPTLVLAHFSHRGGGVNSNFALMGTFPPQNFITFIFPYFFGSPVQESFYPLHWGKMFFWNLCGYVGIMPIVLSIIAIVKRKDQRTTFFSILLILSLFLILGNYTPIYPLISMIPGFNYLRGPSEFVYLTTFSMAVLAGLGFKTLLDIEDNDKRTKIINITVVVLTLLLIFTILFASSSNFISQYFDAHQTINPKINKLIKAFNIQFPQIYIPLANIFLTLIAFIFYRNKIINNLWLKRFVILIIFFDLFVFGWKLNPTVKISTFLDKPKTVQFLEKDKDLYRILNFTSDNLRALVKKYEHLSTDFNMLMHIKRHKELISPDFNMIHHVSTVKQVGPLTLKRYAEYLSILGLSQSNLTHRKKFIPQIINNSNLVNLLNVKYILSEDEIRSQKYNLIYDSEVKIYENADFLPRAYGVANFKVINDADMVLRELQKEDFDPKEYVVLEELPEKSVASQQPGEEIFVDIKSYSASRIVISADFNKDGLLVLTDTFYPGWNALVDGKESRIYRANYLFKAVFLTSGKHEIIFTYDPIEYKLGKYVSLTIILLLMVYFLIFNRSNFFGIKRIHGE